MITHTSPSGASHVDSMIKVLTHGSGVHPISLKELENHLRNSDPTSWRLTLQGLQSATPEEIQNIIRGIESTKRVQFQVRDLFSTLMTLPGGEIISDKLQASLETMH